MITHISKIVNPFWKKFFTAVPTGSKSKYKHIITIFSMFTFHTIERWERNGVYLWYFRILPINKHWEWLYLPCRPSNITTHVISTFLMKILYWSNVWIQSKLWLYLAIKHWHIILNRKNLNFNIHKNFLKKYLIFCKNYLTKFHLYGIIHT